MAPLYRDERHSVRATDTGTAVTSQIRHAEKHCQRKAESIPYREAKEVVSLHFRRHDFVSGKGVESGVKGG